MCLSAISAVVHIQLTIAWLDLLTFVYEYHQNLMCTLLGDCTLKTKTLDQVSFLGSHEGFMIEL